MFVGPSRCESTTEGYRAYRRWGRKTLREDVELFENQILYLIQIRKLKNRVFQEQRVTVTEEEMQQEFLCFFSDPGLIRHFQSFLGHFVNFLSIL